MQSTRIGLTQVNGNANSSNSHCEELINRYEAITDSQRFEWASNLRFEKVIGKGGQGTVFLAERVGADEFRLPVAVKVFSPEPYSGPESYDRDMARIGRVAALVARIQNENMLDVHHFLVRDRIRIMIMEWVEGFDLRRLMTTKMYGVVKERVSGKRWEYLKRNVVTAGFDQPRLQSGAALMIVRDCLAALAALHEEGVVHGDIKPSNIMLNRSGRAKIVDIGLSLNEGFESEPSMANACTPTYASPATLEGRTLTAESDLVSLGYVLVELLSGKTLFPSATELPSLIRLKRELPNVLVDFLPDLSETLIELCKKMVSAGLNEPQKNNTIHFTARTCLDLIELIPDIGPIQNDIGIWIEELLDIDDRRDAGQD